MHGDQGHRVLAGEVRRVELLGRLVLHRVQIVEEGCQRGPPRERAPVLGEVEQPVQVEPSGQAGGGGQGLDVLPGPGPVEDQAADLDEAHPLALDQHFSIDPEEVVHRLPRLDLGARRSGRGSRSPRAVSPGHLFLVDCRCRRRRPSGSGGRCRRGPADSGSRAGPAPAMPESSGRSMMVSQALSSATSGTESKPPRLATSTGMSCREQGVEDDGEVLVLAKEHGHLRPGVPFSWSSSKRRAIHSASAMASSAQ